MPPTLQLAGFIVVLTVASGIFDALAFSYAAGMWREGKVVWIEAARATGSFVVGIGLYFGAVRYLAEAGIVFAEIQALVWFTVTIVGVAVLEGRFLQWQLLDQVVAANVMVCLGWLITRTSG